MDTPTPTHYTAFAGLRCLATGELPEVARRMKEVMDAGEQAALLLFDDTTGAQIEVDLRGTPEEVVGRLSLPSPDPVEPHPAPRGPGRPKLGVVAHEVTLLPRHWEWLTSQPGGASVALRKLVEQARKQHQGRDRVRRAQETAYRFMSALAGNLPHFEEAARALFAGDRARFDQEIGGWPAGVRAYAQRLATEAFGEAGEEEAPPLRTG